MHLVRKSRPFRPSARVISLVRYSSLLRHRDLSRTIAASMIGRLPIGITGLAILLLVQGAFASFARAGAATACYVVGLSVAAPALGRFIDRHGPKLPLMACALVFPAALVALLVAVERGASSSLVLAFAAAAGASFPPITVCMRSYLRQRLRNDELLAAAYSLESVLIELIFIAGPMLVALFVAFSSAAHAVLFAAACGSIGTLLFLRSPALGDWQIEPRTGASLLGPLKERMFSRLIAVILCFSMAFGLLEVGVTAYATEKGHAALAGVLLGLMSAGSALGGLAYGSRSWGYGLERQFVLMLALMGVGLLVLALPGSPWLFALCAAFAGIVMAPALIIQSMLVAKLARAEQMTEAFTWSASALLAGVGIGVAAGGALLEVFKSPAAFTAAAAAAWIAAAAALLRKD